MTRAIPPNFPNSRKTSTRLHHTLEWDATVTSRSAIACSPDPTHCSISATSPSTPAAWCSSGASSGALSVSCPAGRRGSGGTGRTAPPGGGGNFVPVFFSLVPRFPDAANPQQPWAATGCRGEKYGSAVWPLRGMERQRSGLYGVTGCHGRGKRNDAPMGALRCTASSSGAWDCSGFGLPMLCVRRCLRSACSIWTKSEAWAAGITVRAVARPLPSGAKSARSEAEAIGRLPVASDGHTDASVPEPSVGGEKTTPLPRAAARPPPRRPRPGC